ncbi:MAG: hypothetical protein ACOY94_19275 [Bacillota bacterium]
MGGGKVADSAAGLSRVLVWVLDLTFSGMIGIGSPSAWVPWPPGT